MALPGLVLDFVSPLALWRCKVDNPSITRFHEIGRGNHYLFTPLPCTDSQDRFRHQTLVNERPESFRLPVKRRYRPYPVTGDGNHRLSIGKPNVARAKRPLQLPRDGILVAAKHDKRPLAFVGLED